MGLRWWRRIWAPCQKPSHWGSVFANKTQRVPDLCLGDVIGKGYTEVEGPRGGE